MAQIAFWGYQHGLGVTSNTATIAALIGLEYQIRTLCSQPQWSDATLERAFRRALQQSNPEFSILRVPALTLWNELFGQGSCRMIPLKQLPIHRTGSSRLSEE